MLLPTSCGGCGRSGWVVCPPCAAALVPAAPVPDVVGVDTVAALLDYAGPARQLVAGLKYRNNRGALDWLARGLGGLVGEEPDALTWVPTTAARARRRGFDQAELLARALGRHLDRPVRPLLERVGGPAQTGLDRAARRAGPRLRPRGPAPAVVLVVDDVVTTGASLARAAEVLRAAGARRVLAVAAAHPSRPATPPVDHQARPWSPSAPGLLR